MQSAVSVKARPSTKPLTLSLPAHAGGENVRLQRLQTGNCQGHEHQRA